MLPSEFTQRMKDQLGDEYPAFLKSMERPRAVALRINPRKRAFLPFAAQPVPWEPTGYYYDPSSKPGLHPYHEAGVYYLQEASAMAPVALLDPQPGESVCDLCAAPGGKSTQIAARMAGEGFLLCNEINAKRAAVLSRNIERMGVSNALVTNAHPKLLAEKYPQYFDRILVDAPCSGEGMFRKEEAAVTDWSPETVRMCAQRQTEILHSAAQMLRCGGRLVYSTCTFSREENEDVIERFLQTHPEFSPEPVNAPWFTPGENGTFRMWPHKLLGEGHFAAVLRKAGQSEHICRSVKAADMPAQWSRFADTLEISVPDGIPVQFGQSLFLAPRDMPSIDGIRVLRAGLALGELKADRFEPAHALALWLNRAGAMHSLPADSGELRAYLHGDTVPSPIRGWCLVTAGKCSIGWGKGDGSNLKNHYPKGLRR